MTPDVKYLVMGSDGLFDVLPNKSIARLVGRMNSSAQKVCNELVKEVKKRPGQAELGSGLGSGSGFGLGRDEIVP